MPAACPACGQPLVRPEGEGHHFCENVDCPSRIAQSLIHLASRGALDIEGLGEKTVTQFRELGLAAGPRRRVPPRTSGATSCSALPGWKERSVDKLLDGIRAGSQRPLERLLVALNIRHVGPTVAQGPGPPPAHARGASPRRSAEQIAAIDGIGPTIAAAVRAWFDTPRNAELAARARAPRRPHRHRPARAGRRRVAARWPARTFVITGTLEGRTRDEVKAELEALGAKVSGSVSAKTTALIAGDEAGTQARQGQGEGRARPRRGRARPAPGGRPARRPRRGSPVVSSGHVEAPAGTSGRCDAAAHRRPPHDRDHAGRAGRRAPRSTLPSPGVKNTWFCSGTRRSWSVGDLVAVDDERGLVARRQVDAELGLAQHLGAVAAG